MKFLVASKYDCLGRALIYKHICLSFHPSYDELFWPVMDYLKLRQFQYLNTPNVGQS